MLSFLQFLQLQEDGMGGAPTNNIGGGAIQGTDFPLGKKKKVPKDKSKVSDTSERDGIEMFRRKPPVTEDVEADNRFAGAKVFPVDAQVYHQCRLGKNRYHRWDKYVGTDETGQAIRDYGKANPKKPIVLQHPTTGEMLYLRNPDLHNWLQSR